MSGPLRSGSAAQKSLSESPSCGRLLKILSGTLSCGPSAQKWALVLTWAVHRLGSGALKWSETARRLGRGAKKFGAHLVPIGALLVPIGDGWIDISVIKCFSPYNLERRKKKEKKTIKEKKIK